MRVSSGHLAGFLANRLPNISLGVGVVGLSLGVFAFRLNPKEFLLSYLVCFVFFLSISLGSLFFVMIQFLTRAGWSVVVRRVSEHLMRNVLVMAVLAIPVLMGARIIFPWADPVIAATDHWVQGKRVYLNLPFFAARAVLYFSIWCGLALTFFRLSTQQDAGKNDELTKRMQKHSTWGVLIFSVSITFAAIDWIMSLTSHWYSTMIGVYFFGGSVMAALAVLSLTLMLLRRSGFLKNVVTIEHYHDIGKLLYGFNLFWAYIAFSQFIIYWYANIPEETFWYLTRMTGFWKGVTVFLVVGHFAVPFLLFMSRHAKRNLPVHACIAGWLLFMHFVDMSWLILPNAFPNGVFPGLSLGASFLGIGGILVWATFSRMKRFNLVPIHDPRVDESLRFENA